MTPHTIPKLSQYNLSLELGDSNIKDICNTWYVGHY